MHPQVVWLFKELKRFKEGAEVDGSVIRIKTKEVKKFCEDIISRRHALAMFSTLFESVLFEIAGPNTEPGQIARQIDSEAGKYVYRDKTFQTYDDLINDCLNYDRKSSLFTLQKHYQEKYRQTVPSLDINFDEMETDINYKKEAKLFDPSNLFKE